MITMSREYGMEKKGRSTKGATGIVIISVLTTIVFSYVVYALMYKFAEGNKLDLIEAMLVPSNVFEYLTSDSDFQIIAVFIPFIIGALMIYSLRRNIFSEKYSDAS